MEDLVDLLEACHFRLLSAEDWATAQAEEFTVRAGFGGSRAVRDFRTLHKFGGFVQISILCYSGSAVACHFRLLCLLSAEDWATAQAKEFTVRAWIGAFTAVRVCTDLGGSNVVVRIFSGPAGGLPLLAAVLLGHCPRFRVSGLHTNAGGVLKISLNVFCLGLLEACHSCSSDR